MSLKLSEKISDKAREFPESSYGAVRVTLVLAGGRRIHSVFLAGGSEIVKIGTKAVALPEDLDFALIDVEDVISEIKL